MKLTRLLSLMLVVAVAASCSKDDDAEPGLDKVALSLSGNNQVIQVPTSMINNENEYAQMAAGWVMAANGMSANLALFTVPQGATKSSETITALNGRAAATQGESLVYTWSDPQYGTVAYQVSNGSDRWIFELFYKGTNDVGFYRYLYAEEMKDRSAGYMNVYDVFGFMGENTKAILFKYEWARSGDNFNFVFSDSEGAFKVIVDVNTKTKAGSIKFYDGTILHYDMVWDAQGKGSYKWYDSEGNLLEEGTW